MFEVTFEDALHRQWSSEFLFSSFNDAKSYLLEQGFMEKNRLFERRNYKWSIYLKAYITPKKLYQGNQSETKILEGWLGGLYEDLSLHETKKDSERGLGGFTRLHEDLDEFQEKKIRMTIEIIEE